MTALAVTQVSDWGELFVASAGASAALAGLVFVAISINVERILELEGVPELGMITVLLLIGVLVVSMFGLIPDQSERAFGIEVLAQSVVWSASLILLVRRSLAGVGQGAGRIPSRVVLPLFGTVPYIVGAVLLVAGDKSGQWARWYREAIPEAEQLYDTYLKERQEENR